METSYSPQVIRFGAFEVDLLAEELRKNGRKMKLRGQPFQVLAMLLERPGKVVTRDELQKKLWPDGTFVDFDHSLNTAITKIREILGDSAEDPRFIETLARRGYRFIAPVQRALGRTTNETHSAAVEISPGGSTPGSRLSLEPPGAFSQDFSTAATIPKGGTSGRKGAATVAVAVSALLGFLIFWLRSPLPTPKVVGSFQITNDGQQKVYGYDYCNP